MTMRADETPSGDEVPSGLPEGEDDATPLGAPEGAEPSEPGAGAMPGIHTPDEPEVSG